MCVDSDVFLVKCFNVFRQLFQNKKNASHHNSMSSPVLPTSSTLVAPRVLRNTTTTTTRPTIGSGAVSIECSVHTLPKQLIREFHHIFNQQYLQFGGGSNSNDNVLLAIPTNQKALVDLVGVGDHVEQEKDRLLNVFLDFAREFCEKIKELGYWADFIDPCSGLPMLTLNCNKVYSEVDGMECLLNYKAYNAGFCKVLVHPKFGSSVYPATIFAYAPSKLVIELLHQYT